MRQVKFNLFQYSPSYRQSWFAYISLDAMIPQEADQTDRVWVSCGLGCVHGYNLL